MKLASAASEKIQAAQLEKKKILVELALVLASASAIIILKLLFQQII